MPHRSTTSRATSTGFLREVETPPPPIARRDADGQHQGRPRARSGAAAATGVKHMAHRFIVGENPKAALGVLRDLWKDGVASSVDLLGEATVTQAEAQRYADRCAEALDTLADAARALAGAAAARARLAPGRCRARTCP